MTSSTSFSWQHPGQPAEQPKQLPTPPLEDDLVVHGTSTIFTPDFVYGQSQARPDIQLNSSDHILHHVHRDVLALASTNEFNGRLNSRSAPSIPVALPANLLEVILMAVYDIKHPATGAPSLNTLIRAVDLLPRYGLDPKVLVWPATSLYETIRFQTPLSPFNVFALASRYDLEDLAVAASAYLLSFKLQDITDDMSDDVKPLYLFRLFNLHQYRTSTLRGMVFEPLQTHPSTATCNYRKYEALCRAWTLAGASITWDANANTPASKIQSTLMTLEGSVKCPTCRANLLQRVKSIVFRWSGLKATI